MDIQATAPKTVKATIEIIEQDDVIVGADMVDTEMNSVYEDAEVELNSRSVLIDDNDASVPETLLHVNPFQLRTLNDDNMKYLTGHTKTEFEAMFDLCLKVNAGNEFKVKILPPREQMLLTLTKCRLNLDYYMLAIMFHLSAKKVSEIFHYWIDLLYDMTMSINFWSLRARSEELYAVVLDCTECAIEKPSSPEEQQATWSSYKNTNTFKVLVGTDERGMVIFVSKVYGGAITDNLIVEKSNIIQKLETGDYVLSDRGFETSDLFEEKGIILNKPPNKRGQQMSEQDVAQTRAIASRRVHVERVIGLAKKNRIISQKIPHHLFSLMPKIIPLLFYLLNFKPSICKQLESMCNCPKVQNPNENN